MSAALHHELKPLLDQTDGEGLVLSYYADLAGGDGFRPKWQDQFAQDIVAVQKEIGDGLARHALDRDIAAIRKELESPREPGHRWLAVFSANQRGFFRAFPLDVPIHPVLACSRSPYLVPLLRAAFRRREYLAVHTDSHHAQLYSVMPGHVRKLDEIDADVPKKQHSSGELWGLGQATIAQHREEAIHHYIKSLVHRIEQAWAGNAFAGLLLFGQHPMLEHVRKALPHRLSCRVERETSEALLDRQNEVESAIQQTALEAFCQDESRDLAGLWDRLAARRGVAIGPAAVLEALQGGQIERDGHGYLVLGPDPRETVGRCTRCQTLAADVPTVCPRCQAPCKVANLWEEVLLMALRHGIAVHFVEEPERLARYGGIVAMFRKLTQHFKSPDQSKSKVPV